MTESPSALTMLLSRHTRRREFIAGLGSAAAWPGAALAQQAALPVVGFITGGSIEGYGRFLPAFRAGLGESNYIEGRNVAIEYHWLEGRFDRFPEYVAELVRRRPAVIVVPTNGFDALIARKTTTTIPILFGAGSDPVKLGLVASFSHPGGNATGMDYFSAEATSKRLGLLVRLVPKAASIAVLAGWSAASEIPLQEVLDAGRQIGVMIRVLRAGTSSEIEEAFAVVVRERIEALYVIGAPFFTARMTQIATLAAHHKIATAYTLREFSEAGGLMSYGTDMIEVFHQLGAYTGQILKGAKPADLPVVQSTKFEFVINMRTARFLGIDVMPELLAIAEVIE
jgi:putative ABC transport system substrate-binding protein